MERMSGFVEDRDLFSWAAELAARLSPDGRVRPRALLGALDRSQREIRRTEEELRRRFSGAAEIPSACRWILDNAYLARREYLSARGELLRAGRLRQCGGEALILRFCRALTQAGEGRVTEERSRAALDGFQSVLALRRAELQLFPAVLRAAVLEDLASLCAQLRFSGEQESLSLRMEALFGTLRLFSVLDTQRLLNAADLTGAILGADPSGDYPKMDSATRQDYLRRLEKLARREGLEEQEYARRLVKKARAEGRHLGEYLFSPPRPIWAGLYIGANVLLSLGLSLLAGFALERPLAALLLLLPLSELVKAGIDSLLSRLVPPRRLPRMDMEEGVPPEGRTLCVISVLLGDKESARRAAERLELLRLASRREGKELRFGLLADLPEGEERILPGDEEILEAAETAVRRLNRKYGGGFYLFSRERAFDGERWTAPERKRGALTELAKLLCDKESCLRVSGDRDALAGTRFILSLDSDTRMEPGAAGELIGAMLHPLNRPRVDPGSHVVTRGTALIQPRLYVDLDSANATDFALIFAGPGGGDPYGGPCGELYMDAFGSGGFAGKGILDARLLLECAVPRIPSGRILSHDAVEGALLRGTTLEDAAFSDAFPSRPLSYYKRLHRWVRGDWQNLPFLFCGDLAPLERWRLFDKLRRSLLPPATLAAILAGFLLPGRGLALSAWAALLALLSRLLLALAETGVRRKAGPRLRRSTRLLTGLGGAIVECFVRLWLLPWEALVCLSAALIALWRMLVSHKRLLQWQTAAQSELQGGGLGALLRSMWPVSLLGAALLFSPLTIGKAAGLMWLLSPLTAFALSLPAWREGRLSAADRTYLKAAAEKNYLYYRENARAEDHFLPPDNVQEQPPLGPAHRTSPTNIGMALAAAVAAADMGCISPGEAAADMGRILETLERMPRHLGHFFNWYDTRSLAPLRPALISTVDSGNLCASLLTAAQALEEWGEEALAGRVRALLEPMSFRPLFDRERCLFYICYDPREERGTGGWYDLMASESMLSSYLAIARGEVPVKHWRRLSRAQLQKDGYRGLASWTGTMFEYLMPALFLPLYRGGLLRESGLFCLYAQKRRVPAGQPWGVSESAFFSLDPGLSYRYKANGVQALALKRGQDEDLVVSPYSSFLALALDPSGAVRNLRRLERAGALGRWGFLEAVDYTPRRCRGEAGEPVRCWMAHHVGMSVIAAANALCDGSIRRRFLAEPSMAAYSLLLQERLPEDGAVLHRDRSPVPDKPLRPGLCPWVKTGLRGESGRCLLSNGVYHLLLDRRGRSRAATGDLCVYGGDALDREGFSLRMRKNGVEQDGLPERWEFARDRVFWGGKDWGIRVWAAAGEPGELRSLELSGGEECDWELSAKLDPVLAPAPDYESHPSFWKLGIRKEGEGSALLLQRLRRGTLEGIWLCLLCDREAEPDPEGETLRCRVHLRPGERARIRFALCLGASREDALAGAGRILEDPGRGDLPGAAALHLGMSQEELGAAMALLEPLSCPLREAAPRRDLWVYGVSGDDPILCCDLGAAEALPLLDRFLLLKSCGFGADLVYFSREEGEYRQPLRSRVRERLSSLGLDALVGSRQGVHFAPPEAEALRSRAAFCVGTARTEPPALLLPTLSRPRRQGAAPDHRWEEERFLFTPEGDGLPAVAWQLPLSNGRLGAIAADCGPAALWMGNARELPLTKAMQPEETAGAELLWLEWAGGKTSLFAANDGLPCSVCFEPGLAVWEKRLGDRTIRTEMLIPPDEDFRLIRIRGAEGLRLSWSLRPLLGPDASSLRCRWERGLLRAENPECPDPELRLLAGCGPFCVCRLDFTPPAMLLNLEAEEETVLVCGCGSEESLRRLCRPDSAEEAVLRTRAFWEEKRRVLSVETGIPALDHYLNVWAPYQLIACRLWGRASLYQSGGAYGFRDQLQDAVNLLTLDESFARERILDACRHQYVEGDVMHWWHPVPAGDRGVRTRCSDDLLWLPWALCEYVEATGDEALCLEEAPYLSSPPLRPEERDRYEKAEPGQSASVLDHARGAIEQSMGRSTGPHGLPLFGSGDWNDGLDAVEGESVWLAWFSACCAERFAGLLDRLRKPGGQRYLLWADAMTRAAERAWNGRWYERGYWADGEPLGGGERLDLLPQAWAALCENAHRGRVRLALDAVLERLADPEHRLLRLLSPAYGEEDRYPGYLAGYGKGFRENGGQYNHAALWMALGLLRRGRTEEGRRILDWLLPENRDPDQYRGEPFVLAADLCAAPGREGQAGWTWYTGSAGWFFRIALRELLGLELRDGEPRVDKPVLREFRLRCRGREFRVEQGRPVPPEEEGEALNGL